MSGLGNIVKIRLRHNKTGEIIHEEIQNNTVTNSFRKNLIDSIINPPEWRRATSWDPASLYNSYGRDAHNIDHPSEGPVWGKETFSPFAFNQQFNDNLDNNYGLSDPWSIEKSVAFPWGELNGNAINGYDGSALTQQGLLCWAIKNSDGSTDEETEFIPKHWVDNFGDGTDKMSSTTQQTGIVVWGPYEDEGWDADKDTTGTWPGIRKSGVMHYPRHSWAWEDEDGTADHTCLTLKNSSLNMPSGCTTTWASASFARIGYYYSGSGENGQDQIYGSTTDALKHKTTKYGDCAWHDLWKDGNLPAGSTYYDTPTKEVDGDEGNVGPNGTDPAPGASYNTFAGIGRKCPTKSSPISGVEWNPYAHVDFSDVEVTDADTLEIQWTIKFQPGTA